MSYTGFSTLEYQISIHEDEEAHEQDAYEQRLADAQQGIGGLVLLPEGDPASLDDYVSMPTRHDILNTCPHGWYIEDGRQTHGVYHLNDTEGRWEPCDQYVIHDKLTGDDRYKPYPLLP